MSEYYRVRYETEIEADSPAEAAQLFVDLLASGEAAVPGFRPVTVQVDDSDWHTYRLPVPSPSNQQQGKEDHDASSPYNP